jgi:hypothetical protein
MTKLKRIKYMNLLLNILQRKGPTVDQGYFAPLLTTKATLAHKIIAQSKYLVS